jgi:hypothetical protein
MLLNLKRVDLNCCEEFDGKSRLYKVTKKPLLLDAYMPIIITLRIVNQERCSL